MQSDSGNLKVEGSTPYGSSFESELNAEFQFAKQKVTLICFKIKFTILFHFISFHNSQDKFIKVKWANIKSGHEDNFKKYGQDKIQHLGANYDYGWT